MTGVFRAPLAGVALAAWDLFLDPQMVAEGYWTWHDRRPALPGVPDIPVSNYLGWLLVAVVLMALLSTVPDTRVPDTRVPDTRRPGPDAPMHALYLWTYASGVLAPHAVAAAGGQFFAVRATTYARASGHEAVRDRVLEDIELARAVKRAGGRIALADGSTLATCRMYTSWPDLGDGYGKSLWASFSSPAGAMGAVAMLLALYVLPFALLLTGSLAGLTGYLCGVAGRVIVPVDRYPSAGHPTWPDYVLVAMP